MFNTTLKISTKMCDRLNYSSQVLPSSPGDLAQLTLFKAKQTYPSVISLLGKPAHKMPRKHIAYSTAPSLSSPFQISTSKMYRSEPRRICYLRKSVPMFAASLDIFILYQTISSWQHSLAARSGAFLVTPISRKYPQNPP